MMSYPRPYGSGLEVRPKWLVQLCVLATGCLIWKMLTKPSLNFTSSSHDTHGKLEQPQYLLEKKHKRAAAVQDI